MKTLHKYTWMFLALFATMLILTSCDEDDQIGSYVSGHWFGDMDMWIDDERALGSEIEFTTTGWGYTHGTGIEVDYYHRGSITHYFNWRVRDGIIYMTFDDSNLDCAIVDYNIDQHYFRGYIADSYTLENQTYFNLRNYDRYWNEYGYNRNYDGYGYHYVKGERNWNMGNDSLTSQTMPDKPICIRGVNRGKSEE